MSIADIIKREIYEEVDRENPGLFESDPIEYHRLCRAKSDNELNSRLNSWKNIKVRYGLGFVVKPVLRKYAKYYRYTPESDVEGRRRIDRNVFSKLLLFCCANQRLFLDYYRFYWKAKKGIDGLC